MRIAVVGAGAIGGYLGARLALGGEEVTLIARGPHLVAMRHDGVTLLTGGGTEGETREVAHPRVVASAQDAGPQDAVFLTLKAHQVPAVVDSLAPMFEANTVLVTAQNGIPWWYFHGIEGELAGTRLESVDPGGVIWDTLGPERVVGCVVYPATEIVAPGVVRHIEGDRFSLGEPDGSRSDRVRELSRVLIASGLRAPVRRRLRNELWIKLWGNVAFNPISVLTGATLAAICANPRARALVYTVMLEAQAVANALGEEFAIDVEQRIDGAAAVGEHKTSMLQDLERGRRMEIDAVVGAVSELGRIVEVPTPQVDALYALVSLVDQGLA